MSQRPWTLADLFRANLPCYGSRVAVEHRGGKLTYAELWALAVRAAHALEARGIRSGDRVALLLPNDLEYVIADVAIALAGATKVPLNAMLSSREIGYMLQHSAARVLIVHDVLAVRVPADARTRLLVVRVPGAAQNETDGIAWRAFLDHAPELPASRDIDPRVPALIMYTGGTTGSPKGVVHTQGALATNLLVHVIAGEIQDGERMLLATPLPHSAGFHLQACLLQGGTTVLHETFDPEAVIAAVREQAISWTFMVPTMIYRLLDALRARGETRLDGLRTLVYGAAPITRRRLEQALEVFGPVLVQLYGQTEAPNYITRLSKRDHLDATLAASCGRPVLTAEVRIVGADDRLLPHGEVGEVTARAPYTLAGYHDDEAKTRAAYAGEWLRTGDLGYQIDTGHVFLVDRANDVIVSGGMNVYSTEVENVIQSVAGVHQVMVVGVPDDDWGEAVTAFVVRSEENTSEGDVLAACRLQLGGYKVPKRVVFVDGLPLTAYGKPDKKALRRTLWADRDRAI